MIGRVLVALLVVAAAGRAQTMDERMRRLEERVRERDETIARQAERIRELEARAPGGGPDPARIEQAVDRYLSGRSNQVPITAGFDGRFFVQSEERDFRLEIGGLLQLDAEFFETREEVDDTFQVERARIELDGRLHRHHEFRLMMDFGDGASRILDAYYEAAWFEEARLRVGQFKEPFSHDVLTPWRWHDFIERSIGGENLAPGRDIGAMVHGRLFDKRLTYFAGVFNGEGANARDANDDKDVAVRIEFRPFRTNESRWLRGLRLAASATAGRDENDRLGGRTLVDSATSPFLTFAPGVTGGDDVVRYGADLVWLAGPFTFTAEWIHLDQREVRRGAVSGAFEAHDLHVAATYLLTGEEKTFPVFVPAENLDPAAGTWGAFELALRYDWFRLEDDQLLRRGLATGTDEVHAWTAGLNWYFNPHVRFQFNYVYSRYEESVRTADFRGEDRHAFMIRLQLSF